MYSHWLITFSFGTVGFPRASGKTLYEHYNKFIIIYRNLKKISEMEVIPSVTSILKVPISS